MVYLYGHVQIKLLNENKLIICAFVPLCLYVIKFQEKNFNQARDLEVRVRVPVQIQIFFLKFDNDLVFYIKGRIQAKGV